MGFREEETIGAPFNGYNICVSSIHEEVEDWCYSFEYCCGTGHRIRSHKKRILTMKAKRMNINNF